MRNVHVDFDNLRPSLDAHGFACLPSVLSPAECEHITRLYEKNILFRNTISMEKYRFGVGEYRYFNYPLPALIQSLREVFYHGLAPVANEWMSRLQTDVQYPEALRDFLAMCRSQDQQRPTPLLLRYGEGGYNTLHQDIYGELFFPFQVVFMLARPGRDYQGGELVFVEQLPRSQSRAEVVVPQQGDAVIFTTSFRPVQGSKGFYRARMKHGVSRVKKGLRYTLGLIFHDAA